MPHFGHGKPHAAAHRHAHVRVHSIPDAANTTIHEQSSFPNKFNCISLFNTVSTGYGV